MATDWSAFYEHAQHRKGGWQPLPQTLRSRHKGKRAPKRLDDAGTTGEGLRGAKLAFVQQLAEAGLPAPTREAYFALPRRWRIDFAYVEQKIAIEYQGIYGAKNASHASIAGLMRDYRKFTELSLRGWTLILIDANSVRTKEALQWVERALKQKEDSN